MTPLFQIPRYSLAWLLVAQALLITPHWPRLPVWILAAWLITAVWRVQIFRGTWPFPNRWVKLAIVALCVSGLLLEYGRFFGIEPMVGLLVTAFLLKLLEMRNKRDALVVIFLGYFVAATQFLFSQTLLTTLYLLLTVVTLTTALAGVHQRGEQPYPWLGFRLAGTLVLQSIPLMVVLFIIMPRIGSLWAVPQQQHAARTGVSDSMAPGDFSALVRDTATAFRVTFPGDIPPLSALYWRGLVLSRFDGRRWTQATFEEAGYRRQPAVNWYGEAPAGWRRLIETAGEPLAYQVILEPTRQHWLYALAAPSPVQAGIGLTRDFRLVSEHPIGSRFQYRVSSHLRYSLAADTLSPEVRQRELALPAGANPRSLQLARQWMAEAPDATAYIDRVLGFFQEAFTYTLEPPFLGRHSVDEFLLESRRGFCEHFASAFVVMMRAAGIPARVVVGYQGGELNPLKNFLVVRQADAHAWSEIWLAGRGWVRVDPTAAVAPERVESGLGSALSAEEAESLDGPFSLGSYRLIPLLNLVRLRLEALEYDWHRWVMGYDQSVQRGLLRDWLGAVTPVRVALAFLVSGCVFLGVLGAGLLFRGGVRRGDPAERLYRRFLRRLRGRGVSRDINEGPRSLALRVKRQRPELYVWVREVTGCYERYAYGGGNPKQLKRLRRLVGKFGGNRSGQYRHRGSRDSP